MIIGKEAFRKIGHITKCFFFFLPNLSLASKLYKFPTYMVLREKEPFVIEWNYDRRFSLCQDIIRKQNDETIFGLQRTSHLHRQYKILKNESHTRHLQMPIVGLMLQEDLRLHHHWIPTIVGLRIPSSLGDPNATVPVQRVILKGRVKIVDILPVMDRFPSLRKM